MEYKLTYYSVGDWGSNSIDTFSPFVAKSMANYSMFKTPKPNITISLGDNFYQNGVTGISDELWDSAWFSVFIKPFHHMHDMRWFSILGNHDYYGGMQSVNAQIEMTKLFKNWVMPDNNYYSYDKSSSSFHLFIDTIQIYPELYDETKLMYDKHHVLDTIENIEKMLVRAKQLKSKWIFVYGHYHLFSNGYYGNYQVMIERIYLLLKKYHVNAYFSGHEHNFQLFKYDGIYFCVNGAGAYKASLYRYNSNVEVKLIYGSTNNGFMIHRVSDEYFNLQYVNIDNIVEFDIHIPHMELGRSGETKE